MLLLAILFTSFCFIGVKEVQASAGVYAYQTPVSGFWFLGTFADHTYACITGADCYTFPLGTTKTGGTFDVGGTISSNFVQRAIDHAECCASTMVYWSDGVCHQHTNRVLTYAGKELTYNVDGYSLTRWYYGPTGYCSCAY